MEFASSVTMLFTFTKNKQLSIQNAKSNSPSALNKVDLLRTTLA